MSKENNNAKYVDELPKGTRVLLSYGEQHGDLVECDGFDKWLRFNLTTPSYKAWEAELLDDAKGAIRFMRVYGWETEDGDTYSHKVIAYKGKDGFWQPVKLSQEQEEMKIMEKNILS